MTDPLSVTPPAARLLGRKIVAIDRDAGRVELEFTAPPEFLNRNGTVQGGLLAAMLDSTVGCAVVGTLGPGGSIVTLTLNVSFLRAAQPGVIRGSGRVAHRGGKIAFAEGELRDSNGAVVASATATLRIRGPKNEDERLKTKD